MNMFEGMPRERLMARTGEIDPDIVSVFEKRSDGVVEAYTSAQVQHNTLSGNVDSILEHGLVPGHAVSIPDDADVAFARDLMRRSGSYTPEKERKFDIYVAGIKGERDPGVFLSVMRPNGWSTHNTGYGIPERSMILMAEMGMVMLGTEAFDTETREQAAGIYEKYRDRLYRGAGHIAVLEVDPFSPPVINERLGGLAEACEGMDDEGLALALPLLGGNSFEGLYIAEVIPPRDIRVTDITEPLPEPPEPVADLSRSRFYAPAPSWAR